MLTLPATSTTMESRSDLKSRFQEKKTLSAAHFHGLIDSTLNKLDDRFYGVWKEGPYPKEAVVYDDASGFLWKAKKDICSKKPPSEDLENWESATYPYLNFQTLRDLGIQHLQELSGKIWTGYAMSGWKKMSMNCKPWHYQQRCIRRIYIG